MTKRAWKIVALFFGVLTIIACGPPEKPKLPTLLELEYRVGRTLEEQPATHTRITSILGERCYRNSVGNTSDHQFVFDDPRDHIKVKFTDTYGVKPGQSFQHQLYLKKPDGTIKPGGAFSFVTKTPFAASESIHQFDFELRVDASDTNYLIEKGTVLGGFYELGESDRDLSVELLFELRTDIKVNSACENYN